MTSANINEAVLQEAQQRIGSAREFSSDLVPEGMEYVLMDKTLSVLETSMDDNDAGKALRFAKGAYNNSMNSQRFSLVTPSTTRPSRLETKTWILRWGIRRLRN